jgi:hypothetical protein
MLRKGRRPPVKVSQGADDLRLILKDDTALGESELKVIEGMEGGVGDTLVGQGP